MYSKDRASLPLIYKKKKKMNEKNPHIFSCLPAAMPAKFVIRSLFSTCFCQLDLCQQKTLSGLLHQPAALKKMVVSVLDIHTSFSQSKVSKHQLLLVPVWTEERRLNEYNVMLLNDISLGGCHFCLMVQWFHFG